MMSVVNGMTLNNCRTVCMLICNKPFLQPTRMGIHCCNMETMLITIAKSLETMLKGYDDLR